MFYRDAGPKDAPPVVSRHGFSSSSHMFRDRTPDYVGFVTVTFRILVIFVYTIGNLGAYTVSLCPVEKCALVITNFHKALRWINCEIKITQMGINTTT